MTILTRWAKRIDVGRDSFVKQMPQEMSEQKHEPINKTIKPQMKNNINYGDIAQLGEHLPCTQGVKSSNLFISTMQIRKRICYEP